jgi:hypothetical protein
MQPSRLYIRVLCNPHNYLLGYYATLNYLPSYTLLPSFCSVKESSFFSLFTGVLEPTICGLMNDRLIFSVVETYSFLVIHIRSVAMGILHSYMMFLLSLLPINGSFTHIGSCNLPLYIRHSKFISSSFQCQLAKASLEYPSF